MNLKGQSIIEIYDKEEINLSKIYIRMLIDLYKNPNPLSTEKYNYIFTKKIMGYWSQIYSSIKIKKNTFEIPNITYNYLMHKAKCRLKYFMYTKCKTAL